MSEDKYKLNDPAANGPFGSFQEPRGYNYVPQNPLGGIGQINPGAIAPGKFLSSNLRLL